MVGVLYDDMNEMEAAWFASFVGFFMNLGQVVGGVVALYIGRLKWQTVASFMVGGIFFACMAASTPDSKIKSSIFVALGTFHIGWTKSLAITIVTMAAWDQSRLGSASGVA